jgi:hypothetical protein
VLSTSVRVSFWGFLFGAWRAEGKGLFGVAVGVQVFFPGWGLDLGKRELVVCSMGGVALNFSVLLTH